jgi:hypothetical protein
MTRIQGHAATLLLVLLPLVEAQAGLFLMSTDGFSATNHSRAVALGHSATTASLASIVGTPAGALGGYDVIFVSPGYLSSSYSTLQAGVAAGGALEQYVDGGGVLVLNVAGNAGNFADIAPGGVDFISYLDGSATHSSETLASPLHAYLTGAGYGGPALTTADFNNWNSTDHGHLSGPVSGATTVLSNAHGASFIEYQFGSGRVIVTTLTYGWGGGGGRGAPLNNLLGYANLVSSQVPPVTPLPEPSSLVIFGLGSLLAVGAARYRRKQAHLASGRTLTSLNHTTSPGSCVCRPM